MEQPRPTQAQEKRGEDVARAWPGRFLVRNLATVGAWFCLGTKSGERSTVVAREVAGPGTRRGSQGSVAGGGARVGVWPWPGRYVAWSGWAGSGWAGLAGAFPLH